jgi:hypothetical protein
LIKQGLVASSQTPLVSYSLGQDLHPLLSYPITINLLVEALALIKVGQSFD